MSRSSGLNAVSSSQLRLWHCIYLAGPGLEATCQVLQAHTGSSSATGEEGPCAVQAEQRGIESIWLLAFGCVAVRQPGEQPTAPCSKCRYSDCHLLLKGGTFSSQILSSCCTEIDETVVCSEENQIPAKQVHVALETPVPSSVECPFLALHGHSPLCEALHSVKYRLQRAVIHS